MKDDLNTPDEVLNPERFLRPDKFGGDKNDHDGTGMKDKHATFSCRIPIKGCPGVEDGYHAIPYAWLTTPVFMNFAHTLIAFGFSGELRAKDGSRVDGVFDVEIKGEDLEKTYFPLAEARKTSVHPSKPPFDPGDPRIDSVTVRPAGNSQQDDQPAVQVSGSHCSGTVQSSGRFSAR